MQGRIAGRETTRGKQATRDHGLRTGDLKLLLGAAESWNLTNEFNNPGTREHYSAGGHEGIDWDCCEDTPVRSMAAGAGFKHTYTPIWWQVYVCVGQAVTQD